MFKLRKNVKKNFFLTDLEIVTRDPSIKQSFVFFVDFFVYL